MSETTHHHNGVSFLCTTAAINSTVNIGVLQEASLPYSVILQAKSLLRRRTMASSSSATSRNMSSSTSTKKDATSTDDTALDMQSHYQAHSADSYESAFFYEQGDYTAYLQRLVQDRLQIFQGNNGNDVNGNVNTSSSSTPPRRLLDIGGGTGNFTRMLLEGTSSNTSSSSNPLLQAVVVDPFLEHSDIPATTFTAVYY
jgi:hypothetical protein